MRIENSVAFVTGANRGFWLEAGAREVRAAARDLPAITLTGALRVRPGRAAVTSKRPGFPQLPQALDASRLRKIEAAARLPRRVSRRSRPLSEPLLVKAFAPSPKDPSR